MGWLCPQSLPLSRRPAVTEKPGTHLCEEPKVSSILGIPLKRGDVVGWMIAHHENAALAKVRIEESVTKLGRGRRKGRCAPTRRTCVGGDAGLANRAGLRAAPRATLAPALGGGADRYERSDIRNRLTLGYAANRISSNPLQKPR